MDLSLPLPDALPWASRNALEAQHARLQRAVDEDDKSLVVGCAKDLAEATARIVLDVRGETVGTYQDFTASVTRAHEMLDRQPGRGLATDPPVRDIATQLKKLVVQLPQIRNTYGVGHGRALDPDIVEEIAWVTVEASLLWCRWAIRRLEFVISGRLSTLIADLRGGGVFTSGKLTDRIHAANLPELSTTDQHLLGVAVAQRAMTGTFNVDREGVDACAKTDDLDRWPAAYRRGLFEGLFLSRDGLLHVTRRAVEQSAVVLAALPDPAELIADLHEALKSSRWTYDLASAPAARADVVMAMREQTALLNSQDARDAWTDLRTTLEHGTVEVN